MLNKCFYKNLNLNDETIAAGDSKNVIVPLFCSVDFYEDASAYQKNLERFTTEQALVHAVLSYDIAIIEGRHDHFFQMQQAYCGKMPLRGFKQLA